MKTIKYALLGLSMAAMVVACDDQSEEMTDYTYAREFAPIQLEASVRNQTDVRLSWTPAGADSYTVSVYHLEEDSLTSTFMVTYTGITDEDIPYTITGILEGEETYRFDVQTIDADDESRNSKISSVEAITGTESIIETPSDDDMTWNSVTLHFTASIAEGDSLIVKSADNKIVHLITADEAADTVVTVSDLTAETEYTATLKHVNEQNKVKTRGKVSFTTPMNLDGATLIQNYEELYNAIKNAESDLVLALDSFTFVIHSFSDETGFGNDTTKLEITKNITLKSARRSNRAVLVGNFHIMDGASLTLQQVVVANAGVTDQVFGLKATSADAGTVTLENCEVYGSSTTKGLFYNNVAYNVSLVINNSIIHDIPCSGGDFIDARASGGTFKEVTITNSTFYNCAVSRDFIRMDANDANTTTPVITITNNTFYNCGSGAAKYRMFYVRQAGNTITFQKNIVEGFNNLRGFANNSATAVATFGDNYYYNCYNLQSLADGNTEKVSYFDTEGTTLSATPFQDAANADFTLTNEDMYYAGVGDPRWIK